MKTVVITGATSGIGLAVLKDCLHQGYAVIGIGRQDDLITRLLEEYQHYYQDQLLWVLKANLLEADEVDRVAKEIITILEDHYDGLLYSLVNNAGCVRSWYSTNTNGYEQQFAVNHLAAFQLTYHLLPYLIKAKGRILITSSRSHQKAKINWQDIMFEKHYHPLKVYKQSKLANVLFVYSLNQRYQDLGIHAYAVDPGLVNTRIGLKDTGGLVSFIWNLRRKSGDTPDVPAKTYLYLLNQEVAPMGLYFLNSKSISYNGFVNKENADRLFSLSEKLANIKYGDFE